MKVAVETTYPPCDEGALTAEIAFGVRESSGAGPEMAKAAAAVN